MSIGKKEVRAIIDEILMNEKDYVDVWPAIRALVKSNKELMLAIKMFVENDIAGGVRMLREHGFQDDQIAFIMSTVLGISIIDAIEEVKKVPKENSARIFAPVFAKEFHAFIATVIGYLMDYTHTGDIEKLKKFIVETSEFLRKQGYLGEDEYVVYIKIGDEYDHVYIEYVKGLDTALELVKKGQEWSRVRGDSW